MCHFILFPNYWCSLAIFDMKILGFLESFTSSEWYETLAWGNPDNFWQI